MSHGSSTHDDAPTRGAEQDAARHPDTLAGSTGGARSTRGAALSRFILLYALLYAAFGVSSPFMPRFFQSRGLSPEQIGLLLGLGTGLRLLAGPLAGRAADLLGTLRAVLACCIGAAACAAMVLLGAARFPTLLAVSLVDAAVLAPTTTLADALALSAAASPSAARPRFEYGWVRGAASAAFVVGSLVAGQVLRTAPLDAVLWMHAALLACAAVAVGLVPPLDPGDSPASPVERSPAGGVRLLLGISAFRRVVAVSALVLGSHAMHDGFAMVRWNAAGISPAAASALWSEAVVAEVLVFVVVGPTLVDRIGARGAMAVAATAGVVRWSVMALTAAVGPVAVVQPLHGFTFALLHLACMRLVAATVPAHLAATAQAVYAVGATATTAILSIVAGAVYARAGSAGFFAMACLCALALLLTAGAARPPRPHGVHATNSA
jgi:PPP family 3-phenylpropionic acid transporter